MLRITRRERLVEAYQFIQLLRLRWQLDALRKNGPQQSCCPRNC
ncbi:MAG: hypothetical protein IPM37_03525 [Hahellaceae bacterium]|nr:hypothetical protein [Hahellaceae bacterium]